MLIIIYYDLSIKPIGLIDTNSVATRSFVSFSRTLPTGAAADGDTSPVLMLIDPGIPKGMGLLEPLWRGGKPRPRRRRRDNLIPIDGLGSSFSS